MKIYECVDIEIVRIANDVIATSQSGDNYIGNIDDMFSGEHRKF